MSSCRCSVFFGCAVGTHFAYFGRGLAAEMRRLVQCGTQKKRASNNSGLIIATVCMRFRQVLPMAVVQNSYRANNFLKAFGFIGFFTNQQQITFSAANTFMRKGRTAMVARVGPSVTTNGAGVAKIGYRVACPEQRKAWLDEPRGSAPWAKPKTQCRTAPPFHR